MTRYYTTNSRDKQSIPKQNYKQNRVAFDNGTQVPAHGIQQNVITAVQFQNFNSVKMKLPQKIRKRYPSRIWSNLRDHNNNFVHNSHQAIQEKKTFRLTLGLDAILCLMQETFEKEHVSLSYLWSMHLQIWSSLSMDK